MVWVNGLALDAVAVAVAWQAVFAKMVGARLTLVDSGVLAAAVWLIYMADRWSDARLGYGSGARHAFAGRHGHWLLPLMLLVALGAATWAGMRMRWITMHAGLWVLVGVALYALILAASRWKQGSGGILLMVTAFMAIGLVQGEENGSPAVQLWRAIAAGTLLTNVYFGLKFHFDPPPWVMVKKVLGGYLFAMGAALAPFAHLQDWDGLLRGGPVILFAGACALNSMGIRVWENAGKAGPELRLLGKLYPWLLGAIAAGALAQAWAADQWARPVLVGVAACVTGFAVMHALPQRWPSVRSSLVADGWMVLVAAGVLFLGK